jgi:hypothetical protein
MKTIRILVVLSISLFAIVNCSKEDQKELIPVNENKEPEKEGTNRAPLPASSPVPEDGSNREDFTDVLLSWKSSDPDKDEITYDLYFGDGIDAMALIAQGLGESQYMIDLIDTGTTYLWKVITKDEAGLQTESPVFFFTISQKVLAEDVFLRNQQEVNDFGAMGINKIEGDLNIGDKDDPVDISDLTPLLTLNKLEGDLEVAQTGLSDLNGLAHLTSISRRLQIIGNPALQSLEGLDQLQTIGSGISINGNAFLSDLSALAKIEKVNSDLRIIGNPSLQSLQGLENLTMTGLDLVISENLTLQNLDALESLTSIGETLRIESNPFLVSIEGLNSLTTVGLINISENNNLTDLQGLNQIKTVSRLRVEFNGSLRGLEGLEGLNSIKGQCLININPELISLKGLQNISEINGDLIIGRNNSLRNLEGLQKLISVGKNLKLIENLFLEDIKGLSSLSSIGNEMLVEGNIMLAQLNGLENLIEIGNDCTIKTNSILKDFCSLNNLFMNGKINGEFVTLGNQYNPTEKDMKEGACKLN